MMVSFIAIDCNYRGIRLHKVRITECESHKLRALMDDIYRPNAKVGTGSTADAVRLELKTGEQVGGAWHSQKAINMSRSLEKWLRANPNASFSDRSAAKNVLRDMQNALKGK